MRLLLFLLSMAWAQDQNPSVVTIEEQGLLAIESREILLKTGTHHLIITTNANPINDVNSIKNLTEFFEKHCRFYNAKSMSISCDESIREIRLASDQAIQKINLIPLSRKRRSEGALVRVYKYLFGSDDPDNSVSFRSAGATINALESFKDIERALSLRQNITDLHVQQMKNTIETNEAIINNQTQINYINEKLLHIKLSITEQISSYARRYDTTTYINTLLSDIPSISSQIVKTYPNSTIPPVYTHQLSKLITVEENYKNGGNLSVIIGVPLVEKLHYTEYLLYPMPNTITGMIPDFDAQKAIVSSNKDFALEEPQLTIINETLAITSNPILMKKKFLNCAVKTLLQEKNNCPLKPLPLEYDDWYNTPIPNVMVYISNVEKKMQCPGSTSRIKTVSGYIKLTPGCSISTINNTITSSLDKSSIKFKVFQIDSEEDLHFTTPTKLNKFASTNTGAQFNDKPLDKAIDNLKESLSLQEGINILIPTGVGCMLGILLVICFLRRRNEDQPQPFPPPIELA